MKFKKWFKKHYVIYGVLFIFISILLSVSAVDRVADSNFLIKSLYVACALIISAISTFFMVIGIEEIMSSKSMGFKNNLIINVVEMVCVLAVFFICRADNLMFITPAIFVSCLFSILYGYKMAWVAAICNILITAFVCRSDYLIYIPIVLAICLMGSKLLTSTKERSTLSMMGVACAIASFAVSFSLMLLSNDNIADNWTSILVASAFMALNCFISVMLIVGILPLFERISGVLTEFRAQELMNQNSPLLKRLIMEAPGTYHHSVMVTNLAEAASDAIGANTSLVKVAALYHDIGKLKRPQYFGENQSGINPHDNLDPFESRDILFSHISDGVDIAKKYKLPTEVIQVIKSHHGNTTTAFFYYKALQDKYSQDVTEDDFRYNSPKPESKEAVILMLADSVEAAVRSLQEKSEETISSRVDDVINGKIQDNQLSESEISFKEINEIGDRFKVVIGGYYHHRTEYKKPEPQLIANE